MRIAFFISFWSSTSHPSKDDPYHQTLSSDIIFLVITSSHFFRNFHLSHSNLLLFFTVHFRRFGIFTYANLFFFNVFIRTLFDFLLMLCLLCVLFLAPRHFRLVRFTICKMSCILPIFFTLHSIPSQGVLHCNMLFSLSLTFSQTKCCQLYLSQSTNNHPH